MDTSPAEKDAARTVILFDVLGTLVSDPFLEVAAEMFATTPEELWRLLDIGTLERWEQGEIDEATCLERLFVDRRSVDVALLKSRLRSSYRWLPGVTDILADLQRGRRSMHVLSDYSVWYALIEAELGLSRYLPWTFVSCLTGTCKPAAAAFLGPARSLGVPVDQCLLIDDKRRNCDAALELGMDAVHFTNATRLREDLESRLLL